nr:MAG TPA: hypothetical protein [Caudoviricetes sp.]
MSLAGTPVVINRRLFILRSGTFVHFHRLVFSNPV